MVIQNAELYQAMDATFSGFLKVMDQTGTSFEKRERLRDIMQKLFDMEPQQFWKNEIKETLDYVFGMLDLVEKSADAAECDRSKNFVRTKLSGISMHINSLQPREYD